MLNTIDTENRHHLSFCDKLPLSIEKGKGARVWDERGKEYLDFTSGWAVSSLGNCHPAITEAIRDQCSKIMHNPNAGLTYSPARAQLLSNLVKIMPEGLSKFFFTNSGAEANDAAMKLARKITGKRKIVSARMSFHGRTIATASATGQEVQRNRFNVVIPFHEYVSFNDIDSLKNAICSDTAAVILEPIQGEGGVIIPDEDYLSQVSCLCRTKGVLLILDEIQTGFFRTGESFVASGARITPDFLTMAKGIAGGFPFGAVAVKEDIAASTQNGDHGGTYIGNPLGCAVASAVIEFMIESRIGDHVTEMGEIVCRELYRLRSEFPDVITDVRGRGLLWAVEFSSSETASKVFDLSLDRGLILNLKHGNIFRIFPALNIDKFEMEKGLDIFAQSISAV